jgi:hypothetical protein
MSPPDTPNCEKLAKHEVQWNAIYPFIEWLHENHMCIGVWRDPVQMANDLGQTVEKVKLEYAWLLEHRYPYGQGIESLLYKYFDVDPANLEDERRQFLAYWRSLEKAEDSEKNDR